MKMTDQEKVQAAIERLHAVEAERKALAIARTKQWQKDNADRHTKYFKEYKANLRLDCLQHYCGSETPFCMCPGCKETTLEFLTIDHINGGGQQHRKETGFGHSFYQWLKRNNFPPGFQVLCMNCNHSKGHYSSCPHTRKPYEFDLVAATSLLD